MSSSINALTLAATLAFASVAPSYAGGFAEPRIEPEVMAPETVLSETAATSVPGGIILPLILLALIAAAGIASGGGGGGGSAPLPIPIPVPPIGPA